MYKSLKKIIITNNIYGKESTIILDNLKEKIIIDDQLIEANSSYQKYLNDLLRIIRTWQHSQNHNTPLATVQLIEDDDIYTYSIKNILPDNYDSFIDLLFKIYGENKL